MPPLPCPRHRAVSQAGTSPVHHGQDSLHAAAGSDCSVAEELQNTPTWGLWGAIGKDNSRQNQKYPYASKPLLNRPGMCDFAFDFDVWLNLKGTGIKSGPPSLGGVKSGV